MADITVTHFNDAFVRIDCTTGVAMELVDYFTFEVPGARFIPLVKSGFWDGKIRLFNPVTRLIYAGLAAEIEIFAGDRGYVFDSTVERPPVVLEQDVLAFVNLIKPSRSPRDYQLMAVLEALNEGRRLFISPTASGKSFIAYLIAAWMLSKKIRTLIIVPTTTLVGQMHKDFVDYNNGNPLPIHPIMGGVEKQNNAPIVISTWQSIYKLPKEWFRQFGCIIGDEVHTFKAKSLTGLMEKADQTPFRIGMTGTLDGTLTHRLVLEGLFGPVREVTSYDKLLEDGHIVKPKVKVVLFGYTDEAKAEFKSFQKVVNGKKTIEYSDEVKFLINNNLRNKAILSLTSSLKGNILLLFNNRDHGVPLHKTLKNILPNSEHFLVHGGIDTEEREEIRQFLEQTDRGVAACSYKTFGTGINVTNIHHIIFASPTKSRITVLQSIGRGLRLHSSKDSVFIWDLADDLKLGNWRNHTLKHLSERLDIYNSVGFEHTIHTRLLK